MVGLGEGLTDHLPGRDALGRRHLIDGREDLPGQGGPLSCQRTQHQSLDVDGQQVSGARRPPQLRPEAFSCCDAGDALQACQGSGYEGAESGSIGDPCA